MLNGCHSLNQLIKNERSLTPPTSTNSQLVLDAYPGDKEIYLEWTPIQNVINYTLIWSTTYPIESPYKITLDKPTFIHKQRKNNIPYYYKIIAHINEVDRIESTTIECTPNSFSPNWVQVETFQNKNIITWDTTTDREGTSYNLYWGLSNTLTKHSPFKIKNTHPPFTHHLRPEQKKETIYYLVTTVQNGIESIGTLMNSNPMTDKIPSNITLTEKDHHITLQWDPIANITNYTLYYDTKPITSLANATQITTKETSFTHENLTNGYLYYYFITSTYENKESPTSDLIKGIPGNPTPAILDLYSNESQIEVPWEPSEKHTFYSIYIHTKNDFKSATKTRALNINNHLFTDLIPNTTYYFWLTGKGNASFKENNSLPSTVKTCTTQPFEINNIQTFTGNHQLKITWDAINPNTNYKIYFSDKTLTNIKDKDVYEIITATPFIEHLYYSLQETQIST